MLFVRPTILRTRTSLATFLSILASMLVLTVTGAGPAFAFAGDLDPTFGNAGTVVTDIAGNDLGRAVAVLPDGRIVVVGTSALTDLEYDIEVAVYLPSGALDPGFSSDGKLTIDNSSFDFGEAVDVMTEGNAYKIIVGGCTSSALIDGGTPGTGAASDDTCGTGSQMIVAKVDVASGALDPTFGTGGIAVTTTPLIDAVGNALVVQPSDSKILIAGATSGAGRDFAVARFTSAGTIDSLWGVAGYVITDNPNPAANENDEAFGITLQFTDPSTFKVVVAGHSDESGLSPDNYNIAAARYSNLGVLDAGFGAGGFKTTDVEPGVTPSQDFGRDVKIQPGSDPSQPFPGKIVVGGYTNSGGVNQFVAVRYDDNGPEDTTFSGDGKALVDVPGPTGAGRASVARAIDIQPNHKIVLTGASQASSTSLTEFAVVRLTRDGELDPTFSGDGKATTSLSAGADDAWDAVIQPDGKIVAAGFAGPDLGVARYYGDPVAFLSAPPPTTEGNSGLKDFIFTVTLSASSVEEVKLRFTTPLPDDSAVGCAPEVTATVCDYNRVTNTTVTFPAGVTSTTVDLSRAPRVQVRGDTVAEPAQETFDATITSLSGPAAVSPSAGAATATVLDDEPVAVSIGDYADFEGNDGTTKDFSFIVSQTVPNPSDVTTTVSFRTVPDTATSNVDYIARTGTVEIPAGQATSVPPVTVTVNGDNDATESDERFFVEITGVTCTPSCGAQPRTIGDGRGEGLIKDDDNAPRPQIEIGDVTAEEGDSGTTLFNFIVTQTGTTTETVTVTYKTDDCTTGPCEGPDARVAQAGTDYVSRSGQFVFPPGGPTQTDTVTVNVNGDDTPEFDEIFKVTITAAGNRAQVQDGEGRGTIRDDDGGQPPPGGGGEVFTESLGGALIGGPDSASWAEGRLDVFVIGTDNAMWQKSYEGNAWSGWSSLGGRFTSDPSAVSWDTGRIDVFGRGGDNALWHAAYSNGAWTGWESLGGIITSAPDVASSEPGRLDVFARGGDNALWRKTWNGTSWSAWESLGGIISSDPSAVSWGPDRIDVFARGADNALWQKTWDGSSWTGWGSLGGQLIGGPDASSLGQGSLDVFVIGTDKALWQNFFEDGVGWSGWGSWGGIYTSDPSAVSWSSTRIDVFGRGGDNALWHKWQGS